MNTLLDLASNLRDTSAAIAAHEQAITANPSPSLAASLRSLTKRMNRLEAEFSARAAGRGIDVCRYRFFATDITPDLRPVCNALLQFQQLYSLAYEAVKNGAKQIARINEDSLDQSAFGFGYSFSGSLGIVLTFGNRKLDLFESQMDEAMRGVFRLLQATSSQEVVSQGKALGAPTVRAAHAWAKEHVDNKLGADISWLRDTVVKDRIVLDGDSLGRLVDVLDNTSDSRVETFEVEGVFAGGEYVSRHQFHFIGDDGADFKGSYSDAISESSPVQWPKRYRARIQKTTKIFYTSEREDSATYFLEHLTPIQH